MSIDLWLSADPVPLRNEVYLSEHEPTLSSSGRTWELGSPWRSVPSAWFPDVVPGEKRRVKIVAATDRGEG